MSKWTLRAGLALLSFAIAYFAAMYAESFTVAPLRNGKFEGTPVTPLAFFAAFLLALLVVFVIGNILINRYFRLKTPK
jgi:hypothetical protein